MLGNYFLLHVSSTHHLREHKVLEYQQFDRSVLISLANVYFSRQPRQKILKIVLVKFYIPSHHHCLFTVFTSCKGVRKLKKQQEQFDISVHLDCLVFTEMVFHANDDDDGKDEDADEVER